MFGPLWEGMDGSRFGLQGGLKDRRLLICQYE